jgi:hypothetical protein
MDTAPEAADDFRECMEFLSRLGTSGSGRLILAPNLPSGIGGGPLRAASENLDVGI